MINKELVEMLTRQIRMEGDARQFYLSASIWCKTRGLDGTAHFFNMQSEEEHGHMMKIINFLIEVGEKPVLPALEAPKNDFKNYRDLFETSLKYEKEVTESFHAMANKCLEVKDHTTLNFLQWFIEEQVEEEDLFRSILDKLDLIGETGTSIYLLDKELGSRQE